MHVAVVKDGEGPVKGVSYTAALETDPLTIAYAVATFLGFMLDGEKRENDVRLIGSVSDNRLTRRLPTCMRIHEQGKRHDPRAHA